MDYSEKIKLARKEKRLSQKELAKKIGVSESTISKWEKGKHEPKIEQVQLMSDILDKPLAYFFSDEWINIDPIPNDGIAYIPVIGAIACGSPILATENVERYVEMPKSTLPKGQLVILEAQGDSMEPRIYNGDEVLVRMQESFENGDICAVLLDNSETAVLKKVKIIDENTIFLTSFNDKYDPIVITKNSSAKIFGKAIKIIRDL